MTALTIYGLPLCTKEILNCLACSRIHFWNGPTAVRDLKSLIIIRSLIIEEYTWEASCWGKLRWLYFKWKPAKGHQHSPKAIIQIWKCEANYLWKGDRRIDRRERTSLSSYRHEESVVWMHTQHYRSSGAATALLGQILEGFMQIGKLLKAGLTSKGLTFCHSYMFLLFLHNLSLGTATSLSRELTHSCVVTSKRHTRTLANTHQPLETDSKDVISS